MVSFSRLRFHSSMPPIEVLYRLRRQRPDVFNKLEGELVLSLLQTWLTLITRSYFPVYIDGEFENLVQVVSPSQAPMHRRHI